MRLEICNDAVLYGVTLASENLRFFMDKHYDFEQWCSTCQIKNLMAGQDELFKTVENYWRVQFMFRLCDCCLTIVKKRFQKS